MCIVAGLSGTKTTRLVAYCTGLYDVRQQDPIGLETTQDHFEVLISKGGLYRAHDQQMTTGDVFDAAPPAN